MLQINFLLIHLNFTSATILYIFITAKNISFILALFMNMKIPDSFFQRSMYVVGIILWTILWYLDDLDEIPNKTLDWVWFVPTSLLAFQVIFNKKWMWFFLFGLMCIYNFMLVIFTIKSIIIGNYNPIIILLIFTISTIVIWFLKPKTIGSDK